MGCTADVAHPVTNRGVAMRRVRRVIAGKSFFRNNQAKERIFAMTRMQFLLPAMTARPDHNADDYVHVVFIAGEQPIYMPSVTPLSQIEPNCAPCLLKNLSSASASSPIPSMQMSNQGWNTIGITATA
jgi:hypothetical protein